MPQTIVVAVDGDPAHRAALTWAVDRAQRDGAHLCLVHVAEPAWGDRDGEPRPSLIDAVDALLATEREYAVARSSTEVQIDCASRFGRLAVELAAVSDDADMLVIGTPAEAERRHAFAGNLVARVAAVVPCTVAAIPHGWDGSGRGVVVGVDGDPDEDPALDFAAREADAAGEPLTIACAGFLANPLEDAPDDDSSDPREELVDAAADAVLARYPTIPVFAEVLETSAARGLVAESDGSRMLVLGAHDRHGLERAVLGSVAHDVLVNARTPVVVVRSSPRTVRPLQR